MPVETEKAILCVPELVWCMARTARAIESNIRYTLDGIYFAPRGDRQQAMCTDGRFIFLMWWLLEERRPAITAFISADVLRAMERMIVRDVPIFLSDDGEHTVIKGENFDWEIRTSSADGIRYPNVDGILEPYRKGAVPTVMPPADQPYSPSTLAPIVNTLKRMEKHTGGLIRINCLMKQDGPHYLSGTANGIGFEGAVMPLA